MRFSLVTFILIALVASIALGISIVVYKQTPFEIAAFVALWAILTLPAWLHLFLRHISPQIMEWLHRIACAIFIGWFICGAMFFSSDRHPFQWQASFILMGLGWLWLAVYISLRASRRCHAHKLSHRDD